MDSSPSARSSPAPVSDDDMGEDLQADMARDYRAIPELDSYNHDVLDSQQYDNNIGARALADEAMDRRDADQNRRRRRAGEPVALIENDEEADRLRFGYDLNDAEMNYGNQQAGIVNLEDFQGPIKDWMAKEEVQMEVRRRFKEFITTFTDEGKGDEPIYARKIRTMVQKNKCSLEIDWNHLSSEQPVLGVWMADAPKPLFAIFNSELMEVLKYQYPNYDKIQNRVFVRIICLPLQDKLRELRQEHLNAMIKVNGVVTRRTGVFPQLRCIKWECVSCHTILGPFQVTGQDKPQPPNVCPRCSKKVFIINDKETVYTNYQKLTLQESPGSVPAGRIPRSRDVILTDDLVDTVRPGEEIAVVGVYLNLFKSSMNMQQGFPVFHTLIEANYITKENDYLANSELTESDEKKIKDLAGRSDVEQLLLNAIAPSIYGHEYIKRAIALSLFAGMEKKRDKHRIRGDINVLILGDPGVGKSQFLKYTEKLAPRAVYATGKGASAVGLTASVRKDPITGEWGLEGGALVLADQGVCLIDEFDKMNEQDRTSIHEAMEQQSISVSKAGIVTTLQARCAVIAAANPIKGRYDSSLTFVENVDLTDPILSRFDILAVVRDHVDAVRDEMLAEFVVLNHMKCHPKVNEDEYGDLDQAMKDLRPRAEQDVEIDQELLRKYIMYAKKNCKPDLSKINRDKITSFYSLLRQKSMEGGGIPIAVRHIESILRMAEARAKLHLREVVNDNDVDVAIRTLLESFIDSQKFAVKKRLEKQFQRYLVQQTDSHSLLMHVLTEKVRNMRWYSSNDGDDLNNIEIEIKEFEAKARELEITNLNSFYQSHQFQQAGFVLERNSGMIKKIFAF